MINFPDDTSQDYVAPNGVVYRYEDNRWRVKTFDVGDIDLDDYLPLTGGSVSGPLVVQGSLTNQGGTLIAGDREKALQVYDLQGGEVFRASCYKYGIGVQYFGTMDFDTNIVTKAYVDTAVGNVDLDAYLPLSGGTLSGNLILESGKYMGSVADGQKYNTLQFDGNYVKYYGFTGDDYAVVQQRQIKNFMPFSGGQFLGDVKFKDATKLEMGGTYNNNIIDGKEGFTSNGLVPTLGYVKHVINALGDSVGGEQGVPGIAKYKWAEGRTFTSLRPGEISGFTADYTQTSILSEIKYIVWNGVDKDGNRPSPDLNAVDFNSWTSTFQLMSGDLTSTFLRAVGGSHLGKDFCVFQYNKEADSYFVGWDNAETTVLTSTMIRFLPDQVLSLRMPDWFL